MRTLVDAVCPGCGDIHTDIWVNTLAPQFPWCRYCKVPLIRHRAYALAPAVKADSIPGGLYIEHGLCHPDGTPRRYDSHSAIAKAAKQKGLVNLVEHRGERGSDKSPLTQRWV